uniref:indole-3-glycerol-phosphate synthase n=1 Tax=Chromera velia CCMP2878 TaxID=1169474 RepID=A0A0G4HST7_9ALVE|eukprot:Cvel_31099.t1-p1 / transcript=Cvel_31099.t1 / gene=Cvel_31099 / organism=Chromera_velia_CCMP2878 / gene_product=Indole-3-glycerol phosphate synthase, putative / transcript_product=Indole-3-glycerol phosphate synthase, putative / location=Cvel_scaffold4566:353-1143(-) / protein_length=232 / sequence_SO=supercontig / SO=protein_coding / is_pseudo=false
MTQDRCSPKTVVRGHDERDPQKPWQEYQRALERKKYEVQRMMEAHQDKYDPVVMRLNYYQSDPNPKVILSLRKAIDQEDPQRLALVGDLKRKTPSGSPTDREVLSFVDPGDVALKMAELGFDAVFVNCDGPSYGGSYRDLDIVSKRLKKAFDFNQRPAIIAKDIFIHPVQVAMAAEMGADGVILNAGVLGQDLSGMMEACGVMGLEAVVECHSYMDVEMAKQNVATTVLVGL